MQNDTIMALATPPGISALAMIRLSGPQSLHVIQKMTEKVLTHRVATHCHIHDQQTLLDDSLVTAYHAPHSYTGEDVIEISCHGNPLIVDLIFKSLVSNGIRWAKPGEFTQRAFLNGKMDLTQAEAVLDTIHAQSERSLHAAQRSREGNLGQFLEKHRERLLQLLAHLEAYIDFPEEDIDPQIGQSFTDEIASLIREQQNLLSTADLGRKLREGVTIALIGAPNVGKSSLLNTLIGQDRAIVNEEPGTTRDTIEAVFTLEGIQIKLIDTAGLRATENKIEKLGIERTHRAIQQSDLILYLIDGTASNEMAEIPELHGKDVICCITKSDLHTSLKIEGLPISSITGQGIDALKNEIVTRLKLAPDPAENLAINLRHATHLQESMKQLEQALNMNRSNQPPELISSDLRQSLNALGQIVGEATNEDILDRLFKNFCIGK
jgi:tRNA modification GTPase